MYSHPEHSDLTNKLIADKPLNSIQNRFRRMRYLVETRASRIDRYGKWVLSQCEQYEREHRKLPDWAQYYCAKTDACFRRFEDCAHEWKDEETLEEYKELIRVSNLFLTYLPYQLDDAKSMFSMAKLYTKRAKIEFARNNSKRALSNLRHAFFIMSLDFTQEQIQEHIDDGLPIDMASLGTVLLETMDMGDQEALLDESKEFTGGWKIDIDKAVSFIKRLRVVFEEHNENQRKSSVSSNFILTKKVRLIRTEDGGRSYQATAHIDEGELIVSDHSQSVTIFDGYRLQYCDYCHHRMDTFWPCIGCSELSYCSAQCGMKAYEEYHKHECGIYGLMLGDEDYYWMAHVYRHYLQFGIDVATKCENKETIAEYGGEPFDLNEFLNSKGKNPNALAD